MSYRDDRGARIINALSRIFSMRHRDVTLTVALCLSMALHALVGVGAAERYVRATRVWLPGFPVETETAAPIYVSAEPHPEDVKLRLGENGSTGTAIDSSPGNEPQVARSGFQDQPFLSRDPVGPGRVGDPPTKSTALPGDGGAEESPAQPQAEAARPPTFGVPPESDSMQKPFQAPQVDQANDNSAPADVFKKSPPANPQELREPTFDQLAAPSAKPAVASDGRPGPPTAADPAPLSESEIDPVSSANAMAMDLNRGATVARAGRKHRVTRPRLDIGAKADLTSLRTGSLVLKIRIDATGNVQHVSVIKSSGSSALDQICKVAAYEWWFEPLKDEPGQPPMNEFPFIIVF
jgi:TonB family protein